MKIPWHWLLGIVIMIFSAIILAGSATTLWFLVFGRFPAPMFWLILLVYCSVTRPLWQATLMAYLLAGALTPFTAFPFVGMLIFLLMTMVFIVLIRERMFWGGATYFMLIVGVTSLVAPGFLWLASRWIDRTPIIAPAIFDWLISAGVTALFSTPLYSFYQWVDRFTSDEFSVDQRIGPR